MQSRATRVFAVITLCLMAITACGMGREDSDMVDTHGSDLDAILRAKPSFETAQRQYRNAVQGWANEIIGLVPGLTWQVKEDSWGGCASEYPDTRAVHVYVFVVFDGPIPEVSWPQAVDIVERGASSLGATNMTTLIDKPGDHYVVLGGPDGIKIEFGTKAAAVFAVTSDCRLREADLAAPPER